MLPLHPWITTMRLQPCDRPSKSRLGKQALRARLRTPRGPQQSRGNHPTAGLPWTTAQRSRTCPFVVGTRLHRAGRQSLSQWSKGLVWHVSDFDLARGAAPQREQAARGQGLCCRRRRGRAGAVAPVPTRPTKCRGRHTSTTAQCRRRRVAQCARKARLSLPAAIAWSAGRKLAESLATPANQEPAHLCPSACGTRASLAAVAPQGTGRLYR